MTITDSGARWAHNMLAFQSRLGHRRDHHSGNRDREHHAGMHPDNGPAKLGAAIRNSRHGARTPVPSTARTRSLQLS